MYGESCGLLAWEEGGCYQCHLKMQVPRFTPGKPMRISENWGVGGCGHWD